MEEGYQFSDNMSAALPSWWAKIKDNKKFEIQISDRNFTDYRWVKNYRCTKCGYIESYATEPYQA